MTDKAVLLSNWVRNDGKLFCIIYSKIIIPVSNESSFITELLFILLSHINQHKKLKNFSQVLQLRKYYAII